MLWHQWYNISDSFKLPTKYLGFWWRSEDGESEPDPDSVQGPYCLECQADLQIPEVAIDDPFSNLNNYDEAEDVWTGDLVCDLCEKVHKIREPINKLKYKVSLKLKSNYRSTLEKISLEEPLTQVKVRDQDDKYFLSAKIGQKDGKRVGVVYFGEKSKDQNKKDYSQIFVDLDDEQIRFDKSNKHPKDILAKMKVEFPETVTESNFINIRGGEN